MSLDCKRCSACPKWTYNLGGLCIGCLDAGRQPMTPHERRLARNRKAAPKSVAKVVTSLLTMPPRDPLGVTGMRRVEVVMGASRRED